MPTDQDAFGPEFDLIQCASDEKATEDERIRAITSLACSRIRDVGLQLLRVAEREGESQAIYAALGWTIARIVVPADPLTEFEVADMADAAYFSYDDEQGRIYRKLAKGS